MSNIALVRLDSRLAHGTVCAAWAPATNAKRMFVIHDTFCKNEFIKKIHRSAAPAGIVLDTISSDDIAAKFIDGSIEDERTFIIIGDVVTAYKCYEKGFKFDHLQVANVQTVPGKVTKTVAPGVNVNEEEVKLLQELQSNGVNVYFQNHPTQDCKPLDKVVAGLKF